MFGFLRALGKGTRPRAKSRQQTARRPRLGVEALESRLVPSYMVMDVPSKGVYLLDTNPYGRDSGFIVSNHATQLAVDTSGDVAGYFPGQGVYAYSNSTGKNRGWHQLSQWPPAALAIAGSGGAYDVAVSFNGHGTYESTGYGSLTQLTTAVASGIGIDSGGNVLGQFRGQGVWYHPEYSNWQRLTSVDSTMLSYSQGWAALYFPGYGLYQVEVAQGKWQGLTTTKPNGLAVDGNGDVIMGITGRGLQIYWASAPIGSSSHWQQLSSGTNQMGMNSSEVGGYFSGQGVFVYQMTTGRWSQKLSYTTDCFAFEQ